MGREAAELGVADLVATVRTIVALARPLEVVCLRSGISVAQYRLLVALEREGGRAGELATRIGVNRSTLSALATGLEKAHFVVREDVGADLRGVRLELTPEGERVLERAELQMSRALLEQARGVGAERIAELRRLFVRAFLRLAAETKPEVADWPEAHPAKESLHSS
jgi:DNA-binding MarR family transcriptional regulator